MKFIFSSKSISQLENLSIQDRVAALNKAEIKLTAPEKLSLHLLKLVMLVPPFLFLARQEWTLLVVMLFISLLIKQFIFTPVKFHYMVKYLE